MRIILVLAFRMLVSLLNHPFTNRIIFEYTFSSFSYSFDHFRVLVGFIPTERLLDIFFCKEV